MEIMIGERLRELRSLRKTTQEQLARHLGISVQAVSKWERCEGYPDITLLPAIAAYYDVTVDDLLGVSETKKKEKINAYLEQGRALRQQGQFAEYLTLLREAQREFPNEPAILHLLAFALQHDNPTLHSEEIISISKQLLTTASLSGEYFGAIRNLCYAYKERGDIAEAKRYASMAGRYIGTENQLMIHILEGEEAVSFCRWNIETLAELITVNINTMLKKGDFTAEERLQAITLVQKLLALLNEDGSYGDYSELISKWSDRLTKLRDA